jgi:hypothetical protein
LWKTNLQKGVKKEEMNTPSNKNQSPQILTEWDMVTGDLVRDYDNISPELWLELYANNEPDLSELEERVK